MRKRKLVVALTGIRSEYDIFFSPLKAIHEHPDLELRLIVAGAHLASRYGMTVRQIEEDGFSIAERIESLLDSDTSSGRIKSATVELMGVVSALDRLNPDYLLVCGDREEAIVGALAGAYMNIAVAHIGGGDVVVGNVDDSVRHAVTKLSHLHFAFSKNSADRICSMGEESWRVHLVGNPALDRFGVLPKLSRKELSDRLHFDVTKAPVLLVIQHNISSEIESSGVQMQTTIEAIKELGYPTLLSYPNSDAGSRDIIKVIDERARHLPNVKVYQSLPRLEFVNLLQIADVLIGNSSLGLLEAPFLKLPAVNVGNRQKKREHADNVLFVSHDKEAIKESVNMALHDSKFLQRLNACSCPFGDGKAGQKIASVLAKTELAPVLVNKDWAFKV